MSPINNRRKEILNFIYILLGVLVINIISSFWSFRWDLTAEKRYTMAPVTKQFMGSLKSEVLVKVYLTGDLNVGFQKLSRATLELLKEVQLLSGASFIYETVDPTKNPEATAALEEFGLKSIPVFETAPDGRKIQSNVYPYAIFNMGDTEVAVSLLENLPGRSGAENLNISIESLEFKVVDAMRRLMTEETSLIAFLEGHGELDEWDVYDITKELSKYYQVDRGVLGSDPSILDRYEAVIIAKPSLPFSEKDKFILDQYMMRGGRLLWLVDAVNVTLDSLRVSSETVGLSQNLNISDLLFRYGVRINQEVIQDTQSAFISINVSGVGEQPKLVPVPWMFNPLLNTNTDHPVTRNLNAVRGEFVSSIDTVGNNPTVEKEFLLQTGRYSRRMPVPVYISLAMVNEQPLPESFNDSRIPVAVSLEGTFPSLYAHRPIPPGVDFDAKELKTESAPTRMIVVADGDIIKNEVRMRHGSNPQTVPLGYDEMSNQTFGNKQFIVNAVNYLGDDMGWMSLRNRNYQLRLLNREVLSNHLTFWKWLNVVLPLVILLLLGIGIPIWRKHKYGRR